MKFIKITNLFNKFGQPDYKGLDIDKFIVGSQHYDMENAVCITATTEEVIPTNTDITKLTEADYDTLVINIENAKKAPTTAENLQTQIDNINVALANIMGV